MKHATILLALLVAGCTTASDLSYSPTLPPIVHGAPVIGTVTVTDLRGEPDPTYVGGIRTGIGTRLKTLVTRRPVADDVRDAFTAALKARGMFSANGRDILDIRLLQLSSNQVARREATTAFSLELRDAGGRLLHTDRAEVTEVNGSVITFDAGALASIEDLSRHHGAGDDGSDRPGAEQASVRRGDTIRPVEAGRTGETMAAPSRSGFEGGAE